MRVIVNSLSLVYFLLNIIIASSLLLELSCSADSSPFYYCVPLTQLFSETFSIKVLWFRLYFLLLRCHILTGSSNWAKVGWTYIHKGVTVRFGFDAIRTSQLPNVCQEQSNGDAPWDVSYIQPLLAHSI